MWIVLWGTGFASTFAQAAPLPSWLPKELQVSISKLPSGKTSEPCGMLYYCDPYCETIGEFFSRTFYQAVSSEMTMDAGKEENLSHLRFLANPDVSLLDPRQSHDAEEISGEVEALDRSGDPKNLEEARSELESERKEKLESDAESSSRRRSTSIVDLGAHLDTFFGSTTLSTSGNTDTASDAQLHALFGGGLLFSLKKVSQVRGGEIDLGIGLDYWNASGEKSRLLSGQTWSSVMFQERAGIYWHRPESRWSFGFLLDGRQEVDSFVPDTAVGFSTKYIWVSPGIEIRYLRSSFRLLKSIFSSVQDVADYRGTSVSSSRTSLEGESCALLAHPFKADFEVCGLGELGFVSVQGTGNPSQPVFSQQSNYTYRNWQIGIEFKLEGFRL